MPKVLKEGIVVGLKDHILITRDGRRIPIGDSAAPIVVEHDGIVGVVLIFSDMTDYMRNKEERERLIGELRDAIARLKTLHGLIPICAACKKIRDDKGYWNQLEVYIKKHSGAEFTHGMCPECARKYYPQLYKDEG